MYEYANKYNKNKEVLTKKYNEELNQNNQRNTYKETDKIFNNLKEELVVPTTKPFLILFPSLSKTRTNSFF